MKPTGWLGGLAILLLFLLSIEREIEYTGSSLGRTIQNSLAENFCQVIYDNFVPAFSFVQETRSESNWFAEQRIIQIMPLYGYSQELRKKEEMEQELLSLDAILLAEAQEGNLTDEGESLSVEGITEGKNDGSGTEADSDYGDTSIESGESLEALLLAENEAASLEIQNQQQTDVLFVPHKTQVALDWEALVNYEKLVEQFYSIDKNTMAGSELLDVNKLLGYDMRMQEGGEGPQILIYHTHSQETFADSVAGDPDTSIVGVGERLAEILTDTYGYNVLHHKGQYDVEVRDDAYSNALPALEQLLQDNPSIQVVIDLHRDEMPEEKKLLIDLDGRPTARFMFFNGLSRTRKTGDISYLYNENLGANLAFSFQMQEKCMEYYPGLTRKIYLKGYRYNMHLKPKTLLVEMGAQNNTVQEVMNACDPLAHVLDLVLRGQ